MQNKAAAENRALQIENTLRGLILNEGMTFRQEAAMLQERYAVSNGRRKG
ncbi:MAG: hypothetical protein U5N55_11055 [Cypionkella sp.]|nr:hypothetical protein [Cypionkella sp.]